MTPRLCMRGMAKRPVHRRSCCRGTSKTGKAAPSVLQASPTPERGNVEDQQRPRVRRAGERAIGMARARGAIKGWQRNSECSTDRDRTPPAVAVPVGETKSQRDGSWRRSRSNRLRHGQAVASALRGSTAFLRWRYWEACRKLPRWTCPNDRAICTVSANSARPRPSPQLRPQPPHHTLPHGIATRGQLTTPLSRCKEEF